MVTLLEVYPKYLVDTDANILEQKTQTTLVYLNYLIFLLLLTGGGLTTTFITRK